MTTSDALRLLLPAYVHVVGLFASAILAWAAIRSLLRLPRPWPPETSRPLRRFAAVSLVVFVALVVWTEGLPFGATRASHFASLCESAGPQIHRRLTGVQGFLLDQERPSCSHYDNIGPPSSHALLRIPGVRFVEYRNHSAEGGYYREGQGDGYRRSVVPDSQAEVVIRTRTIVSRGEIDAGICGEEVTVNERASNTPLAVYRYFWTDTNWLSFRRCPKGTQDATVAEMVSESVNPQTPPSGSASATVVRP